jgi:PAS domain S-box-containing protein
MNRILSNDVVLTESELLREITNLKSKIYDLEAERKHYRKIINQFKSIFPKITNPLLLTDVDGKIIDANREFIDLLGYTLFDLKRMTIKSLTPMNLHENETKILNEELSENKKIESRWCEFFKINGQKIPVELTVHANHDENGVFDSITRIVKSIL